MKKNSLAIILIIVLGFIVYANSLNGKFIWDDESLVEDNIHIRSFSNIKKIFTEDVGKGARKEYGFYRPFQSLSYMIDYFLWGLDVRGYHLMNMVLHIFVALSLFWFLSLLFGDMPLSLFAAVLYLVNPIHTEAVAYISGRSDSLSTLFMLLTFILYIKFIAKNNIGIGCLAMLSYTAALLSRESSLILVALLLLYHYTFRKKIEIKQFLPILSIAVGYIIFRLSVLEFIRPENWGDTAVIERVPGFFAALATYIKLMLFPFHLHMEYGTKSFNLSDPTAITGVVIFFTLLIYAFRKRDDKVIFFSVLWFLIGLLPVSNIYPPLNAYMAEHWLYVPSIGFFLILAKGLNSIYKVEKFRFFGITITVAIVGFYSYLTMVQNNYWKDPIVFYERTLKYEPDSYKACHGLATKFKESGRLKEAIVLFNKVLEINPYDVESYNNLGNIYKDYEDFRDYEKAIAFYKKAIEIKPTLGEAYANIALVYLETARNEQAVPMLEKAIEVNPNFFQIYGILAGVYYDLGEKERAIETLKKGIGVYPQFIELYCALGDIYHELGKTQDAITSYKRAITVNPNHVIAYNNLAAIYYNTGQYDLAIKYYDKALALGYKADPAFLEALSSHRK